MKELLPVAAGAPPAAPKKVIRIHSDPIPTRLLALAGDDVRLLESGNLARALLRRCFGNGAGPESIVSHLDVRPPQTTIDGPDSVRSPSAACVRKLLVDLFEPSWRSIRLRIVVRYVPNGDGGASDPPPIPSTESLVEEEIAELGRMLTGVAAPSRQRELLMLLGARQLEASGFTNGGDDARLAAAHGAFGEAFALAETEGARGAALHGMFTSLTLLGKLDDAAIAARALTCPSRHPSPTAHVALDQDHPAEFWSVWETVHSTPISLTKPAQRKVIAPKPVGPRTWDEETKYRSPYEGCAAPPDVPAGYVVDAWRGLAAYHAEHDPAGGPFRDNRRVTALRLAVRSARGEVGTFATLELGRALVRQQRFGEAARVLGRLASPLADRDLTERAAQLVAASLAFVDLEGPDESEPFIERADVLDTETSSVVVERKMSVVVERLERPELVPQNDTFTPLVARWLAFELGQVDVHRPAIATQQRFLTRFPNHRDAPVVQWEQARTYELMSSSLRAGTPEAVDMKRNVSEARARLTRYVGTTPWTEANRNDAEALARAVQIARAKP